MKKNITIVTLAIIIIWFALVIVKLENYHYAVQVGMCSEVSELIERDRCVNSKQTRTSFMWHLYYALF